MQWLNGQLKPSCYAFFARALRPPGGCRCTPSCSPDLRNDDLAQMASKSVRGRCDCPHVPSLARPSRLLIGFNAHCYECPSTYLDPRLVFRARCPSLYQHAATAISRGSTEPPETRAKNAKGRAVAWRVCSPAGIPMVVERPTLSAECRTWCFQGSCGQDAAHSLLFSCQLMFTRCTNPGLFCRPVAE